MQYNKKIIDFLYQFSNVIKKDKWIPRYSKDTDSLSFRKPKLSNSARIKYFDDEIAFYLNKDKDIEGLFIEYFRTNFIKHHKEDMKEITQEIDDRQNIEEDTMNLTEMTTDDVLPKFEEIVKNALLENIEFRTNNKTNQ